MSQLTIVSSRSEGGPHAALEASTAECKIISTAVGHSEEILHQNCIFNTPDNAVDIISNDIKTDILSKTLEYNYKNSKEYQPINVRDRILNMYHEARGQGSAGLLGVSSVVLNRVADKRFPNNICDVVHDGKYWKGNPVRNKCAFSYYCDGKSERINNEYEYSKVVQAAMLVLQGIVVDNMEDVVYYHATYVNPSWASQKIKAFQIGKHIFYKEK